jgi:hypothetical protein
MSGEVEQGQEVVLITRPAKTSPPNPLAAIRGVFSSSVDMATYTMSSMTSIIEQTITSSVESSVNAALDRLVPLMADAIMERIDINKIVLEKVDLNLIVNSALDSLDLTQLVIDRVDVNAIVAEADIDAVIDRVPIIPLANYIIDEIDLPQIIRSSTGGIAGDAVKAVRVQSAGADQLVSRVADRVIFRRKRRNLDAPGDPESLMGRMQADMHEPPEPLPDEGKST